MRERVMDYEAGRYAGYGDRDMEKRERLTDEELIEKINGGETACMDVLIERYKRRVRNQARPLYLMGGDSDDLIQEGMLGLFKAIRDYRPDKQTSFLAFAELCVTRQIITAIKAATRQKHKPLNSYISLNKPVYDEESDRTLIDIITGSKVSNPEDIIIDQEDLMQIEEKIGEMLSDFEWKVLCLYLKGKSYQEIAQILGRRVKSIDNALQRVKNKLEKHLEDSRAQAE